MNHLAFQIILGLACSGAVDEPNILQRQVTPFTIDMLVSMRIGLVAASGASTNEPAAASHSTLVSHESHESRVSAHHALHAEELDVARFLVHEVFLLQHEERIVHDIQIPFDFAHYIHERLVLLVALLEQPLRVNDLVDIGVLHFTAAQLAFHNIVLELFFALAALLVKTLLPVIPAPKNLLRERIDCSS